MSANFETGGRVCLGDSSHHGVEVFLWHGDPAYAVTPWHPSLGMRGSGFGA